MKNRAVEIHDGLKHPVIDGDGHWLEPIPVFLEYLSQVGGAKSVDQMRAMWRGRDAWYRATPHERQHNRLRRAIWWGVTSNTYDKATALLPSLLNERLPELGIDFALIYPSFGLSINGMAHGDLHRAAVRAYNMMTADMFAPFAARFAPVAIVPTHTPAEALEDAPGQLRVDHRARRDAAQPLDDQPGVLHQHERVLVAMGHEERWRVRPDVGQG